MRPAVARRAALLLLLAACAVAPQAARAAYFQNPRTAESHLNTLIGGADPQASVPASVSASELSAICSAINQEDPLTQAQAGQLRRAVLSGDASFSDTAITCSGTAYPISTTDQGVVLPASISIALSTDAPAAGDSVTATATYTDPGGASRVNHAWTITDEDGNAVSDTEATATGNGATHSTTFTMPSSSVTVAHTVGSRNGLLGDSVLTTATRSATLAIATTTTMSAPAPVVNAGADQTGASAVEEGDRVMLTGAVNRAAGDSVSSLGYQWQQVNGSDPTASGFDIVTSVSPGYAGDLSNTGRAGGATVTTTGPTAGRANDSFTAPPEATSTTYYFRLTGTSTRAGQANGTASAIVAVTVNDTDPPTAIDAGTDIVVAENSTSALAGSATGESGETLTYRWAQTPAAPALTIADGATPMVTWPDVPTLRGTIEYSLTLTVTDSLGNSGTDTVGVVVHDTSPPTASASGSATLAVTSQTGVQLDARSSRRAGGHTDSSGLAFLWEQVDGANSDTLVTGANQVTLSSSTAANPTFTAPATQQTLHFKVTVTDDVTRSTAVARASVTIALLAAYAGPDLTVNDGDSVTLSGSVTGGGTLTYTWEQVNGGDPSAMGFATVTSGDGNHAGALSGATGTPSTDTMTLGQSQASFTAPNQLSSATYYFRLTGGMGANTASDITAVTVNDNDPPTAVNAGEDFSVAENTTSPLAGSASGEGSETLTYSWSQSPDMPALNIPGGSAPMVTWPDVPTVRSVTEITLTLTATDSGGLTATDEVAVTIRDSTPPTAGIAASAINAAPSQANVQLDASQSRRAGGGSDTTGITFAWVQTTTATGDTEITSGDAGYAALSDNSVANPTFTAPASAASLYFRVTVTDMVTLAEAVGRISVTVAALSASAGADQSVDDGDTVTLGGTVTGGGGALSYTWEQVNGNDPGAGGFAVVTSGGSYVGALSGASGAPGTSGEAEATFTAPDQVTSATYYFRLSASDSASNSDSAIVTITVNDDDPPAAVSAGADFAVAESSSMALAGSATGEGSETLSYAWTQSPATPALTIAASATPTVAWPAIAMVRGTIEYTLTLTVTDSANNDATDTVVVTVHDTTMPTASSDGSAATASFSQTGVQLDARASRRAGGHTDSSGLTFLWEQVDGATSNTVVTGAGAVALSDPAIANPTFTAPAAAATLYFKLTVTDAVTRASAVARVTVTVSSLSASAGSDQTVSDGGTVTLSGTVTGGSSLTYAWAQVNGNDPAAPGFATVTSGGSYVGALDNGGSNVPGAGGEAEATFTAPDQVTSATYYFQLTGSDGTNTDQDIAAVTVNDDDAPTAMAGADARVPENTSSALSGSATGAEGGETLTYAWSQSPATPALTIGGTATPTVAWPDIPAVRGSERYELTLTVTDSAGNSHSDVVAIVVHDTTMPTASTDGSAAAANLGQTGVQLDARASRRAGGHTDNSGLAFLWEQVDGATSNTVVTGAGAVALSSATAANPTFTAPAAAATLYFKVTVTDAVTAASASARVTVNVSSIPAPTVSAGANQNVADGETVTLTGTVTGGQGTLSYQWEQVNGSDPSATGFAIVPNTDSNYIMLSGASGAPGTAGAANATFTSPNQLTSTTYHFRLTGAGNNVSARAITSVIVTDDDAPTVVWSASSPRISDLDVDVAEGEDTSEYTLYPTVVNPDTDPITCTFSAAPASPAVPFSTPSSCSETDFGTPELSPAQRRIVYTITFTVRDTQGNTDSITTTVTVSDRDGAPSAMVASAVVSVAPGGSGSLDAGPSTNAGGAVGQDLRYAWIQTETSTSTSALTNTDTGYVALSNPATATATFTAPSSSATLHFRVAVTDTVTGQSDSARVEVQVEARTITVTGISDSVNEGATLTMNIRISGGGVRTETATLTYSIAASSSTTDDDAEPGDFCLAPGGAALSSFPSNRVVTFLTTTTTTSVNLYICDDDTQEPAESFMISFSVSGDGLSSVTRTGIPATITITASDQPNAVADPGVSAGAGQTVNDGDTVTLMGSVQRGAGDTTSTLAYAWVQVVNNSITASAVTMDSATYVGALTNGSGAVATSGGSAGQAHATFAAPNQRTSSDYYFLLTGTATDPSGALNASSVRGVVTITVNDDDAPDVVFDPMASDLNKSVNEGGEPDEFIRSEVTSVDGDDFTCLWTSEPNIPGAPPVVFDTATNDCGGMDYGAPELSPAQRRVVYTIRLTATDSFRNTGDATTTFIVSDRNGVPTPHAGADQEAPQGAQNVQLDATSSTNAVGAANTDLTYSWMQVVSPTDHSDLLGTDPLRVTLSGANTATPSFNAPATAGALFFLVDVEDTVTGRTNFDVVQVTVYGPRIITVTGPGATVNEGDRLTFTFTISGGATRTSSEVATVGASFSNTSATTDDDAEPADFCTTSATTGAAASLGALAMSGQALAPGTDVITVPSAWICDDADRESAETFNVAFSVSGAGLSTVVRSGIPETISIAASDQPQDIPAPTVNAGADQTVAEGARVALLGSVAPAAGETTSTLAYDWVQVTSESDATVINSGANYVGAITRTTSPTGAVSRSGADANQARAAFTAPQQSGISTTYYFQLTGTASDPGGALNAASASDVAAVTVNGRPTANAGADQQVRPGAGVALDGSASASAGGAANSGIAYAWIQTADAASSSALASGAANYVALTGADSAMPTFTAPGADALLHFLLTVTDSQNSETASDRVQVRIDSNLAALHIVTLAGPNAALGEGGDAVFTFNLTAPGGANARSTALTVSYTLGGSARGGVATDAARDYTAPATLSVTFPASGAGATVQTITLPVNDDTLNEADETISVTLGAISNVSSFNSIGGASASGSAAATIRANDPANYSIADAGDTAEPASGGAAALRFRVTLSAASAGAVTIPYILSGSATGGDDYTNPAPLTVTVAAGDTSAELEIAILPDNVNEAAETIGVTLGATPSVGAGGGVVTLSTASGANRGSGSIPANDPIEIALSAPSPAMVNEGGTLVFSVQVTLAGSTTAATSAGAICATFNTAISAQQNPAGQANTASNAANPNPDIELTGCSGPLVVVAADGSATGGVNIFAGQSSALIPIRALFDNIDEGATAEVLQVTLVDATGLAGAAAITTAAPSVSAQINNVNALRTLEVSAASVTGGEDDQTEAGNTEFVEFTASMTGIPLESAVTVGWVLEAGSDNTAHLPGAASALARNHDPGDSDPDFDAVRPGPGVAVNADGISGTISFPAGPLVARTVRVPVRQDALNEGREQLALRLSDPCAGQTGVCTLGGGSTTIPTLQLGTARHEATVPPSDPIVLRIERMGSGTVVSGGSLTYVVTFGSTTVNSVRNVPIAPSRPLVIRVPLLVNGGASGEFLTLNANPGDTTLTAVVSPGTLTTIVTSGTPVVTLGAPVLVTSTTVLNGAIVNLPDPADPTTTGRLPEPVQTATWSLTQTRPSGLEAPEGESYRVVYALRGSETPAFSFTWNVAPRPGTGGGEPARADDFNCGTASAPSPCTSFPSGTLRFSAGNSTESVEIPILDDGREGDLPEGFTLNLSALSGPRTGDVEFADAASTLPNSLQVDIPALQVQLRIANNPTADEGEDAVFMLSLGNFRGGTAITQAIEVAYTLGAAADTATSGEDYAPPPAGAVTIPVGAGEGATQPIAIPLLVDGVFEQPETFTLSIVLSGVTGGGGTVSLVNAAGEEQPQISATATISGAGDASRRRGERVSALLAVLDRSTAVLATDAIGRRLERGMAAGKAPAAELSVANRNLIGGPSLPQGADSQLGLALYGAAGLGAGLPVGGGVGGGGAAVPGNGGAPGGGAAGAFGGLGAGLSGGANMGQRTQLPSLAQLLQGSRFSFSALDWKDFLKLPGLPGETQLWGSGGFSNLEGGPRPRPSELRYNGEHFGFFLGADHPVREDLLAGVAIGYSLGDLDFTDTTNDFVQSGTLENNMLSVHPYLGWWITPNVHTWLVLGYGTGSVDLDETDTWQESGQTREARRTLREDSDSMMWMFAAGLTSQVELPRAMGLTMRFSLGHVRSQLDAARFDDGALLPKTSARSMRLGGEFELHQRLQIGEVQLEPFVNTRMRMDTSDAVDRSAPQGRDVGFDVGGGIAVGWAEVGLNGRVSFRGQFNETGHEEQRVALELNYDGGADDQGITLALQTAFAGQQNGLLAAAGLGGPGPGSAAPLPGAAPGRLGRTERSLSGELGYGVAFRQFGRSGLLTPYGRFDRSQSGNRYAAGLRLAESGGSLQLGLEAGLSPAATGAAGGGFQLLLKGDLRF